jgi:replicative DNA helicase
VTSYDPERALLTRVVDTRDIRKVINGKVTAEFFGDPDNREVFEWLTGRFDKFGKVPSLQLLQDHFPDFKAEEVEDDVELIVESVREKKLYADLQVAVKKIATEARGDVFEALQTLKQEASNLSVSYSGVGTLDLTKSAGAMRKKYRALKKGQGMLGVPFPWPRMNRATRGMKKGGFTAFYGDPGTMKTWLLLYVLFTAWKAGHKVILFTQEMPAEDMMMRFAAMMACVSYDDFQNGKLSVKEEKRFELELSRLEEGDSFIVEELDSTGSAGLTEVQAKIQEHDAAVAGIDGLGDMCSNSEWGSWWEICKGVKGIARRNKIHIVGVHHTNRTKKDKPKKYNAEEDEDASDVALGEALFRYTDSLFHIVRTPQHKDHEELAFRSKKVREGKPCTFTTHAIPVLDFSEKRSDEEDQAEFDKDEDVL